MIPRRKAASYPDDAVPIFTRKSVKGPKGSDPLRPDKQRIVSAAPTPEQEQAYWDCWRKRMEECFGPGAGRFRVYIRTIPRPEKGG
uniref:Uncharacterized protein n=1 Tax=viral metagenome TaxID=1070528 RepID=A0A6M3KK80_9ZZZZ